MSKLIISNAMRAGFNAADMVAGAKGAVAVISDMVAGLKAGDKEALAALRADIIAGVIARDLFAGANLTAANVTKAQAVMAKAGKARTEAEARAESNARKIWSRALKGAGIVSSHGNAGNANAGKVAADKPAKVAADKPAKLPAVSNDKMTREAWFALVNDTLASLESIGHGCEDVAAAEVKILIDARTKLAARAKIEK